MNYIYKAYRSLLTEASAYKEAKKYALAHGLTYEQYEQVSKALIQDLEIHGNQNKLKFLPGLVRFYIEHKLTGEDAIRKCKTFLSLIASGTHFNEYDQDFNGEQFETLVARFEPIAKELGDKQRSEVDAMGYGDASETYQIVRIDSFEQACEYGDYTSWCITHDDENYSGYGLDDDDFNQAYFCLKPGFEGLKPGDESTGAPLDEYGLSMVSVIVDENGQPSYVTTRYNHDYNGENVPGLSTPAEVSKLVGVNFYQVFKPNNRWKEILDGAKQRLANGENPRDVFNECGDFYGGYAKVALNDKSNHIDRNGNFLSNQWWDGCGEFREGYAWVRLNWKYNHIDKNGKLLSDQWWDECFDFSDGYARVTLNGKYNYIDKNGKLLSDQWWDDCGAFREVYAWVELNRKFNHIDQNGKLLSEQWWDGCYGFSDGYARVDLNGKYNHIDRNGNVISDRWWSGAEPFIGDFAKVRDDSWKQNFIGKDGKLLLDTFVDMLIHFSGDYAQAMIGGLWYKVSRDGRILSHVF